MRTFVAALIVAALPFAAQAMAGKEQAFGQGVTLEDRVAVAELAANPEAYVGQTIRVEGVVARVQEKHGAWVELTDGGATVRVDVDAKRMSFPDDVIGKRIAVQGVFAKRTVMAKAEDRADEARDTVHGKSDLPTGEKGKSEYAHAAEHGKSDLPTGEKGKSAYAHADDHGKADKVKGEKPEKGEKGGKADKVKGEKPEKGEKVAAAEPAEKAEKPEKVEKPAKAERVETVVYELQGTGAIVL